MAQHSHVPKFGGWDKDNIPYTACFENARKDKSSIRMNPNDPEENPEAFIYGSMDMENNDIDFSVAQTPLHPSVNKSSNSAGQKNNNEYWRNHPSNYKKRISITSESDNSASEYSPTQSGGLRQRSDNRKKGLASQGSNSISTSNVSQNSHPTDASRHQRAASIPKFGAWDETDPRSSEGFTGEFNRVKEERKFASATFPPVPQLPRSIADGQKSQASSSSGSKFCCCLSSFTRA